MHRSPVNFLQLQPMSLPAPNQCYMILSFLILFTPRVIFPLSMCFLLNSSDFFFFLAATRINLPRSLSILTSSQWEGHFWSPKRRCSPKHMKCCLGLLSSYWPGLLHPWTCPWRLLGCSISLLMRDRAGSCLAQIPLIPVFTYDSSLTLSPVSNPQY